MTELASGAITAVDTVTIELGELTKPRRSSSSDGLPRQPSFTRRFRLARILLHASSPPPSRSWRSFDGSNGCEPDH
jgi:hypothetical protein